ncbi:hypothetical protein SPRG_07079 [Saprolegnia parasitica CBS 223.65]|uniref:Uncharacterized protein n=1 Tax=Saprolegnia parasitica (strain CBS 223.65) TaxID=695850 RepID=A0A067CE83_SAPPC|nr:hypothetical protein SPRG_07079 [Saprolegnia parasitica CBS 223.65]KDO27490.1 hypothetical protein SPRG_07079 [Saprolegnia parasitica CBS 223.65]|eukprot:XP_012201925.1 hypothetical protein SPRG_07079 [Saprolegnia parasitica CBS 223.65]
MLASKPRPSLPSKSKWQSSTHLGSKPLLTKQLGLDQRKKPVFTRRDSAPRSSNNEPEKSPAPSTGPATPLRRCRSASSIRQKIIDASDFGNNNLISHTPLATTAAVVDLETLPPPASVETCKYAKKTGLASQKSYASMALGRRHKFARSSATVLEMELAERLGEIEMAQVPQKQRARLQVARDLLDQVILQDRTYAGILLKIRTEFNKHFDITYAEPSDDVGAPLDVYLARTENQALKQLCVELQNEVDQLRHVLRFEPLGKVGTASMPDGHEDDDVSLVLPGTTATYCVPQTVPKLNFAALSPYQDDDDDGGGYVA